MHIGDFEVREEGLSLCCDTMVAVGDATAGGETILAKNSDRPPNESQPLDFYPARDYSPGSVLACTHIEIDEALHTNGVIGSRPFWIWGFEHGVNDHGVAAGNEAVFSRDPVEEDKGLLGMDLLRLGLERGDTAYETLKVIVELLERYGQGGAAVWKGDRSYHNSFIIADSREAWILETSNRRWVARRVEEVDSISNIYSTEYEWDEISSDAIDFAKRSGWTQKHHDFSFAQAYTDTTFDRLAGCEARYARSQSLLNQVRGPFEAPTFFHILRDHYENTLLAPRWSADEALVPCICMHAGGMNGSKTAASMVAVLHDLPENEPVKEQKFTLWAGMSNPCTSIFRPFYNVGSIPEELALAGERYSEDSPWWQFERLARLVETNYTTFSAEVQRRFGKLESLFLKESKRLEQKAEGERQAQKRIDAFKAFTASCCEQSMDLMREMIDALSGDIESGAEVSDYRLDFLRKASEAAGLTLPRLLSLKP